jgi:hypothetical protein
MLVVQAFFDQVVDVVTKTKVVVQRSWEIISSTLSEATGMYC